MRHVLFEVAEPPDTPNWEDENLHRDSTLYVSGSGVGPAERSRSAVKWHTLQSIVDYVFERVCHVSARRLAETVLHQAQHPR